MKGESLRASMSVVFFAKAYSMEEAVAKYLEPLQELASNVGAKIEAV